MISFLFLRLCPLSRPGWGDRRGLIARPILESLENRRLLTISFEFDYSYDAAGYFAAHPQAQALLQQAGQELGSRLSSSLAAITPDPSAGNIWTATFMNPADPSQQVSIDNLMVPANTLIVFVGTSVGSYDGLGGPGGWSALGSPDWETLVACRGQTQALASPAHGFGPWGGTITFNVSDGQAPDFAVMLHELVHVLGIGTAASWYSYVDQASNLFTGPNAEASYGGPVPLDQPTGDAHWATGTKSGGICALMTESDVIQEVTPLDWAGLEDVGWQLSSPELGLSVAAESAAGAPISTLTYGQGGTLVATGTPVSSGTMAFVSGSTLLGTAAVDSAGKASLSLAGLPAGSQTVAVVEVGTNASGTSDSGWSLITLTVTRALPVIDLVDKGGTSDGQPYAAMAAITGVNGQAGSSLEGVPLQVSYTNEFTGANLVGAPVGPGHYLVQAYFPGSADYLPVLTSVFFTITSGGGSTGGSGPSGGGSTGGSGPSTGAQPVTATPEPPIPKFHGKRLVSVALPVQFDSAAGGPTWPSGTAVYEIVMAAKHKGAKPRIKILARAKLVNGASAPSFRPNQIVGKSITVVYSGDATDQPLSLQLTVLKRSQLTALVRG